MTSPLLHRPRITVEVKSTSANFTRFNCFTLAPRMGMIIDDPEPKLLDQIRAAADQGLLRMSVTQHRDEISAHPMHSMSDIVEELRANLNTPIDEL